MREILITSAFLILCVLLIRRIFREKVSRRLLYALWLLVALRLMIPGSAQFGMGPLSQIRLMDLLEEDKSGITERLEETVSLEEPIQMTIDARSIWFRLFADDAVREAMRDISNDGPTAVFLAGKLGFTRLDVLRFIWIAGMVVVSAWILITNMVFGRRLKKSRKPFDLPEEICTAASLQALGGDGKGRGIFRKAGRFPVFYLAEGLASPCLYGFLGREAVYLSADVVEDNDRLRHVVVHELVHKKHGDSFWAILRSALVAVYWFHPLVWVAAVCSKRDCELACDEGALSILGEEERISYGETLLSIITRKGRASDLVCTATTMTGSGKSVKERIQFIAKEPRLLFAAAAGALFLTAAVCLFVFTRDAGFNGITVDSTEGLTVTGADMQISLPASIGGISGCVVEKESDDVIIYHLEAQEEVGRFARMPLRDALQLVDEGREVLPVGDHGYNYLLRAYLGEPLSRTEHVYHTYTPANEEAGVLRHEDVYLPTENIITEPIDEARSVTQHTYTPVEEAGMDIPVTEGVAGTDSNEDTTYIIDDDTSYSYIEDGQESEGNVDYLPTEQITETEYQPREVNVDEINSECYVYVTADYEGKVREKYRDEMGFIDSELKAAADQVIILSLNRERREALFDALTRNRTPYVGDNVKTGALLDALPLPPTLNRTGGFSLQTVEEPYSLRFDYEMSTDTITKEDRDMLYFNAVMLFYAIGNVEEIAVGINRPAGTEPADMMEVYYREELGQDIPALLSADFENEVAFREKLSTLHSEVESFLSSYNFYNF